MPDDPVLDPGRLHSLTRGDAALMRELLRELLQEGREEVARARDALANGDRSALALAAHKLKGMAAELGALRLQATAISLEATSNLAAATSRIAAAERALDELLPFAAGLREM